jgi:hypothetical protein
MPKSQGAVKWDDFRLEYTYATPMATPISTSRIRTAKNTTRKIVCKEYKIAINCANRHLDAKNDARTQSTNDSFHKCHSSVTCSKKFRSINQVITF